MAEFVIVPDSSCDLTADLRERYHIPDYLHCPVYLIDGREILSDLDWEVMSDKEYFASMKGNSALVKTASAPLGEIERVFTTVLEQGKDVLSISLSSGLSSNYKSCCLVADELRARYPERKIICVDSLHYSTSLGLLISLAAAKQDEGATIEETAAFLETERFRIHQMGTMDDLFFLVKTGRITNFKAFFGNLVGLNLLADFNRSGMAEVLAKFKGKRDVLTAILAYMEKTAVDIETQTVFIAHSDRLAVAEELARQVEARFHPKEIIIRSVGMSCGASIGPGLCCAFYRGAEVSEGLAEEKAIMDAISADIKAKK